MTKRSQGQSKRKKQDSTKTDQAKLKKKLLQSYQEIKKKFNDHNRELFRADFLNKTTHTRHEIEKTYGTWGDFRDAAEEFYRSKLPKSVLAVLSERTKKFDPNATADDCIKDLRAVQEANDGYHITRNYYRNNGKYSDSTWSQHFGTFQEFRRQAGLELTRQQHHLETKIARHASTDHYRKYFKEEVLPYYEKYQKEPRPNNIKKILAMSDLHDKECCEFTLSVFIDTCKRKQPDVIVLNGDIYDLLEFGRYKVDPRHYDIKSRFDFVRDRVFKPLRKACPNAQIDLIAGNHEMRLLKLLADATPNVRILLSDVMGLSFADIFGLDEFEINWASKFDLGAYTKADIKNETKKNYRIYYDTFAFAHLPDIRLKTSLSGSNGHHHKGIIIPTNVVDPLTHLTKHLTWSQTPGMHAPDAEYLDNVPGWNTGFLEVTINVKYKESFQKIHYTNDKWCEVDGVYYENTEK